MGYDVRGSDLSEAMLEVAAKKINITLQKADFHNLEEVFSQKFDAIVCLSNAVNDKNVDPLRAAKREKKENAMQVTEHVHALRIPFSLKVNPETTLERFVYVFLIYGQKICLIDSGVAESEKIIFDYIKKTGRRPEEISTLIQTHTHPDHIGSTKTIKKISGCEVFVHAAERNWIENIDLQYKERPIPGFYTLVEGSVKADHALAEGDVLDLRDNLKLKVFHSPGHSKGSISLFLKKDGVLFSGDAIPVWGDLPVYEDYKASVNSIRKLRKINGINYLLASWDKPQEGEKTYQLMEESLEYLQQIHDLVRKNADKDYKDIMDLCRMVANDLDLPASAVTSHLAKTFAAHLEGLVN